MTRFEGESRETYDKRKEIVKACGLKAGMAVADVGAGTGLFTRLFAQEVGRDGTVYAVEISQKFLDHIAQSAKAMGVTNVRTVLGKDLSVELPANSVDLVFICDTYHHFEYPHRMMTSIHKALKPGGRVVVVDFIRIAGQSSDWVMNHVRAGQDVVEREVAECGFKKTGEKAGILKDNYIVVFEKKDQMPAAGGK
ncbi:MAG: methyltransferase domain-containing protein [Gemmataceae bacterium]|nr:methyltransferase domain-containing protein [Gemmataceae bacterium]